MTDRPNILFLFSDEHSCRFLSALPPDQGGEPCRTPALDGLIERGAWFQNAYCQMPLCTPSRMAMLAGRHPHQCGAWSNECVLRPEIPTFASALSGAGYRTCAVGKMHLGGSVQFAGFDARPYGDFGGFCSHQPDPLPDEPTKIRPGLQMRSRTRDAGVTEIPESMLQENMVVRESMAWLREHRHANPRQPWMLFASFSRPHFPFTAPRRFFDRYYPDGATPPRVGTNGDAMTHPMTLGAMKGFKVAEIEPEEARRARAAYFACVDFLDEVVGDFLALLGRDGLLDNTAIIYASDHGEMAGEHGLWFKNVWHEASVRVPLIVSLPEHRSGALPPRVEKTPVSLADVFPTLCGLSGAPKPEGLAGVDLAQAARGEVCPELEQRRGVFSEALASRWGEGTRFRMIRSPRHKYVVFDGGHDLAFDLIADPDEQRNLAGHAGGEIARELRGLREAILDGFDFDEAEAARLRDLEELPKRYPKKSRAAGSNQIFLPDGRLVEAETSLYRPEVCSDDPRADFNDFPGPAG